MESSFIEDASLLAQSRTHPPGKLGEVVGHGEESVGTFNVVAIEAVLPFGLTVTKRTTPVAERHTALHAPRGLLATLRGIKPHLHLFIIVHALLKRPIATLTARYIKESFRISHKS